MDDRRDPDRRQAPDLDEVGRRERPADRHEHLERVAALVEERPRWTGRAPAVVADPRLEGVEGRLLVPVRSDGVRRDPLGLDRADHDVRRAGDLDVERAETTLDGSPFRLERGPAPIEDRRQVLAAGHEPGDLGERHADVAERDDPAQLRQLRGRIGAVRRGRVDPRGAEQTGLVPRPEGLGRDAAEVRERADPEHRPRVA